MPIDSILENKNKNKNNELKPKLEVKNTEKILGKVWDDPRGKFSISALGALSSIGLLKLIYDAVKNTENGVKLTPNDIAWIKKNMILFAQKLPLCWHNVFMQLLVCPEYIYYSSLPDHPIRKSQKIMTMIDFAKSELNKEFTGNFLKRKVKVPLEVRQMPDDIILKRDEMNNQWVPENNTLGDKFRRRVINFANNCTKNPYVGYDSEIDEYFLNYDQDKNGLVVSNKKFKDIKIPNNVILEWDSETKKYYPKDSSLDDKTKDYIIELANHKVDSYVIKNDEGKFIFGCRPNKTQLTDNENHSFVLSELEYICNDDYLFDNIKFNELGILDVPVTEYCESDEICGRDGDEVCHVEKPINEVSKDKVQEARSNNSTRKLYGWNGYEEKEDAMKYYTQRAENILIKYTKRDGNIPAKDINCCQKYGYYPTFIVIFDNVDYRSCPHFHCCYIVYDKNKKIKYFLWGDGCESGFRVMPANKSLEKLNKYSSIWVKYSRSDIVEKFYTP